MKIKIKKLLIKLKNNLITKSNSKRRSSILFNNLNNMNNKWSMNSKSLPNLNNSNMLKILCLKRKPDIATAKGSDLELVE